MPIHFKKINWSELFSCPQVNKTRQLSPPSSWAVLFPSLLSHPLMLCRSCQSGGRTCSSLVILRGLIRQLNPCVKVGREGRKIMVTISAIINAN